MGGREIRRLAWWVQILLCCCCCLCTLPRPVTTLSALEQQMVLCWDGYFLICSTWWCQNCQLRRCGINIENSNDLPSLRASYSRCFSLSEIRFRSSIALFAEDSVTKGLCKKSKWKVSTSEVILNLYWQSSHEPDFCCATSCTEQKDIQLPTGELWGSDHPQSPIEQWEHCTQVPYRAIPTTGKYAVSVQV